MSYPFVLPSLGEKIEGGDVVAVKVRAGDVVRKDQAIIEVETGKAVVEVPAPFNGKVMEVNATEGQKIKVGEVICVLEKEGAAEEPVKPQAKPEIKKEAAEVPAQKKVTEATAAPVQSADLKMGDASMASPATRALAREMGVDLSQVGGSGRDGRVTREDILNFKNAPAASSSPKPLAATGVVLADDKWGPIEVKPLSSLRRAVAENLSRSWSLIPHVTQFDEADLSTFDAFKLYYADRAKELGIKITITAVLAKIVSAALQEFPQFNASIDLENDTIIYKKHYHIGIAVDTERGLVVPTIRDADQKSIVQLSQSLSELAAKARDRKLAPDDMQGGTFTISNLGGLGTTYFTPIINWPQVAILGLGKSSTRAVQMSGKWEPRSIMPLSLSYDHRLIDGADAARFLRFIAKAIESPLKWEE